MNEVIKKRGRPPKKKQEDLNVINYPEGGFKEQLDIVVPEIVYFLRQTMKGNITEVTPEQKWSIKLLWDGILKHASAEQINDVRNMMTKTQIILDFTGKKPETIKVD